MISVSRHRWAVVALGHCLTLFFLEQLNFYLAPYGIEIFVLGMLVAFSSLELNYRQGLLSLAPVALLLDSKTPLPFGFCFVTTLTLFTISHATRSRVRREVNASALASSILLNLMAFAAYTLGAIRTLGGEGIHFGPLALNLFASSLVVALVTRIFFEAQTGALALCGINLAEEQREAR